MEKIAIQHGDLILVETDSIPASAKIIPLMGESFIAEKGEGTNTHEMTTDGLDVYDDNGTLYFKTSQEVSLIHQEHKKRTLLPGKIHKKRKEREWDYESEEARNTKD
ncbi:MAG: hypothetical protein QME51_06495 [Planctomycetota bacterium]|nr:hypothetical protein [Planctomycetota bacterium]